MAGRRPHHSTNLEAPAPAAPRNSARRQRGTSDGLGWAGSISSRLVPRLVLLWVQQLVLFPLAGAAWAALLGASPSVRLVRLRLSARPSSRFKTRRVPLPLPLSPLSRHRRRQNTCTSSSFPIYNHKKPIINTANMVKAGTCSTVSCASWFSVCLALAWVGSGRFIGVGSNGEGCCSAILCALPASWFEAVFESPPSHHPLEVRP